MNVDIKRLKRIASIKKCTETKVLTEIIRLTYAGLTMPKMEELGKMLLTKMLSSEHNKEAIMKVRKLKRKVLK